MNQRRVSGRRSILPILASGGLRSLLNTCSCTRPMVEQARRIAEQARHIRTTLGLRPTSTIGSCHAMTFRDSSSPSPVFPELQRTILHPRPTSTPNLPVLCQRCVPAALEIIAPLERMHSAPCSPQSPRCDPLSRCPRRQSATQRCARTSNTGKKLLLFFTMRAKLRDEALERSRAMRQHFPAILTTWPGAAFQSLIQNLLASASLGAMPRRVQHKASSTPMAASVR